MIIGGIQKNSLIDFPSKISCVIFTAGCNFDCPYCHNPELVNPPFTTINPEEIFAFLKKRKFLLDGVVITGGEPTLQQNLPDFCDQIKTLGFPIKMDTNGSRPEVIHSLIKKNLIDYIAMDIKTLPEKYSPHIAQNIHPDAILESIHSIKNSKIPHEFRTTCVKPFVDADIIFKITRIIEGADLFVLQKANICNSILHPEFFQNYDWKFVVEDITSFQKIASPFVKKTMIR
ncbi:MAG: anaerobic ribonucleoside-triphosphate reductase activating protein [Desulfobacteraceae bacterium]|nr:anaerobic ribonucleoside-triphosphate reductase activating protein [Desulfobacteraceae bacterium]MBC2757034.1 anaerobic ribonucleoside-triphosphate reductase activating protein [Desulfobacteraceae bacterium]